MITLLALCIGFYSVQEYPLHLLYLAGVNEHKLVVKALAAKQTEAQDSHTETASRQVHLHRNHNRALSSIQTLQTSAHPHLRLPDSEWRVASYLSTIKYLKAPAGHLSSFERNTQG
jgi:hypothetical protein